MNQAKVVKIYALSDLKGMSYDQMVSVIKQLIAKPDCSNKVAFLDIGEIYGVGDLESEHALTLLYQKINKEAKSHE